jgi:uncharacterized protein (TIGR00725 family)
MKETNEHPARRPVIGVMGGSKADAETSALAEELGGLIARRGWILLNGGRDCGVMAASARGAREAGGLVVGVLPGKSAKGASPHLDVAIVTGMGDARNVINVLSSDVVVACPGELGTRSEIDFALKNEKPVILLRFDPGEAYDKYRRRHRLFDADTPAEAVRRVDEILADWAATRES